MKILIEISESQFADIQRIASVQLKNRLPTVEQIIASGTPMPQELIRCRTCRWHEADINQCGRQVCAVMYDDDFCSLAERKEGEEDEANN